MSLSKKPDHHRMKTVHMEIESLHGLWFKKKDENDRIMEIALYVMVVSLPKDTILTQKGERKVDVR